MPTVRRGKDGPKPATLHPAPDPARVAVKRPPLAKPRNVMSRQESALWDAVVASVPDGHFCASDARAVMSYCRMLLEWRPMSRRFAKSPQTRFGRGGKTGAITETAESRLERTLRADLVKIETELGLVPDSKTRRMMAAAGDTAASRPEASVLRLLDGERNRRSA
ncbi:MAG: hypothetical protein OXI79_19610 [Gammaproteobacteria bacterium]|nr:hypothetical protein [Gammaproteobacteria bacterium]